MAEIATSGDENRSVIPTKVETYCNTPLQILSSNGVQPKDAWRIPALKIFAMIR
jgi:hypothetical protein